MKIRIYATPAVKGLSVGINGNTKGDFWHQCPLAHVLLFYKIWEFPLAILVFSRKRARAMLYVHVRSIDTN